MCVDSSPHTALYRSRRRAEFLEVTEEGWCLLQPSLGACFEGPLSCHLQLQNVRLQFLTHMFCPPFCRNPLVMISHTGKNPPAQLLASFQLFGLMIIPSGQTNSVSQPCALSSETLSSLILLTWLGCVLVVSIINVAFIHTSKK